MHLTWQLTIVVVVIHLSAETVEGIWRPNKVQLSMPRVHPTILTIVFHDLCHILYFVGIVVLCIGIFTHQRESKSLAGALLIA